MVNYAQVVVGSALLLIVGVVLLAFSYAVVIPGPYRTFLGIPYASNPEYGLSLMLKGGLMIFGIIFIVCAPLYALVEMVSHKPSERLVIADSPPPPPSSGKMFCRFCGTQNEVDALFCKNCGKKMV